MIRSTSIPCARTTLVGAVFRGAVLAAAMAVAVPVAGTAQADPFAEPPLHVLEVVTRSRWVHAAVPDASVPFAERRDLLHLRHRPARRNMGASLWFDEGGPEGNLVVDERNVPTQLNAVPPSLAYGPERTPSVRGVSPNRLARTRFVLHPSLVETRLFEVPVPLPGRALEPGLTWTERTRIDAGSGLETEALEIDWRFTAEGDTALADDRRRPIVRVEGDVTYRLVQGSIDRARSTLSFTEREGSGHIVGRIVIDTVLGIRAAGADTIRLEGTSTLTMPDGRRFTEPASFERMRTFAAFDSAAWDVERERRMAERRRTSGGMVLIPGATRDDPPLPQARVDSLWAAWTAAEDDFEGRQELERQLWANQGGGHDLFLDTLAARRLAGGDSTMVLRDMPRQGRQSDSLGLEEWATMAPFLHDPGRAWRWQLGTQLTYVANTLLATSPLWEARTRGAFCRPEACDAILADMEASPEPRLREVAAVWRFAQDPSQHWPEVLALQESGSLVVERAVAYGRGVGAQWAAATGLAMPDDGADWRTWLEWMGGRVRFEGSHRTALRFFEARTGRDPLADLERRWTDLPDDSSRLIIGTILRGSDRLADPTPDEIVGDLLSGEPARIDLARRALRGRYAEADTLSPAEAAPFLRAVLDSMATRGTSPWPSIADEGYTLRPGQGFHGATEVPVFVLDGDLDDGLLGGHPFSPTDSTTWADRDRREGAVLVRFRPVQRVGDLIHLDWEWSARFDRAPDETPEGYAGGEGVWLVRVGDDWRLALTSAWIT